MKSGIDRLAAKIRKKIDIWFEDRGEEFIVCLKEFCQGNRMSLTPLMEMVEDLGKEVFADGKSLNRELLDQLETRIFDLIGVYSSFGGGEELIVCIRRNIVQNLTSIFADAKRNWNLNYYKITQSVDEIDPDNNIIPDHVSPTPCGEKELPSLLPSEARQQARDILDKLVLFAREKFNGEKNKKIALNWLENPERISDIRWLSSKVGSSSGSTKVTLTRIKKSLIKNHMLKRHGDRLTLDRVPVPVRRKK